MTTLIAAVISKEQSDWEISRSPVIANPDVVYRDAAISRINDSKSEIAAVVEKDILPRDDPA